MSDDLIGCVFLGAFLLLMLGGYLLARKGLDDVKDAADDAKEKADEAQAVIVKAQQSVTNESGAAASQLAQAGNEVAQAQSSIQTTVTEIQTALASMTGTLAPARVVFGMALLCLLTSITAFDIISLDFSAGAGDSGSAEATETEGS